MRASTLVLRSLSHYWRSNLACVAGFAIATAVLAGALAVGDSVRESLAQAALRRLGRTTHAVEANGVFREELAGELGGRLRAPAAPLLALPAVAVDPASGRRASEVMVYGVDERFWSFHGLPDAGLEGREALVSESLLAELKGAAGGAVQLWLESAADVPGSTLFGRRDTPAERLRVTLRGALPRAGLGEFALRPARDEVRAAFVPLALLQRSLGMPGRVNTALLSVAVHDDAHVGTTLGEAVRLEDLGLRVRPLDAAGSLQLDSTSSLLDDATARVAREVAAGHGLRVTEALIYLATTIRGDGRELPYAVVAAVDDATLRTLAGRELPSTGEPPLLLNDWAAADLAVAPGTSLVLDYYVWREEGVLATLSASFELAGIVPISGLAADRDLVPEYPGITDALRLSDWDPPFPIDLRRIGKRDESYWDRYRTTPKAFVSLETGQELWGHRLGRLTSMRFTPGPGVELAAVRDRFTEALRAAIARPGGLLAAGPAGIRVDGVRAAALRAAEGSADFGAYFIAFSFFLVTAALLLAALFYRLAIEQRQREVGLLGALGFSPARLRWQYLAEGAGLAATGAILGMGGAVLYAAFVLWGLRSLWSGLLPTGDLALYVAPSSLGLGALGAVVAGTLAVVGTLRDVHRLSLRALLAGVRESWSGGREARQLTWPLILALAATVVGWAARVDRLPQAAGFFVGGSLLLVSAVLASRALIGRRPAAADAIGSVAALGRRGAAYRPGRSVLCVGLIAAATFVIVAVGAFRRKGADMRPQGEAGGYALLAWSLQPLHSDPGSAEGLAALGLSGDDLRGVSIAAFRARRGEDASCLNLHRPQQPTVLAAGPAFLRARRFSFQASLARTAAERENPWLLLEGEARDGAIPAIADSSSLAYVLHRKLGDVLELGAGGVRLRFVGALRPGLLQGEVLVGERHFRAAFPAESGYRFFLIEAPSARVAAVASHLESRLADFGLDVSEATARLSAFHRVENMYISTFQALGALGLLLGTAGLAAVLVRNALEQRRELALLRAVGYEKAQLVTLVLAENALLLLLGFAAGALPALVAIEPILEAQRGGWPVALILVLAAALAMTGAAVSFGAVAVIRRMPLLASLRSE